MISVTKINSKVASKGAIRHDERLFSIQFAAKLLVSLIFVHLGFYVFRHFEGL